MATSAPRRPLLRRPAVLAVLVVGAVLAAATSISAI
jgi:hypothetical protein